MSYEVFAILSRSGLIALLTLSKKQSPSSACKRLLDKVESVSKLASTLAVIVVFVDSAIKKLNSKNYFIYDRFSVASRIGKIIGL